MLTYIEKFGISKLYDPKDLIKIGKDSSIVRHFGKMYKQIANAIFVASIFPENSDYEKLIDIIKKLEKNSQILNIESFNINDIFKFESKCILDPFSGSGTFPLIASKMKIKSISGDTDAISLLDQAAKLFYPSKLTSDFLKKLKDIMKKIASDVSIELKDYFSQDNENEIEYYRWVFTYKCPSCNAINPLLKSLDIRINRNKFYHIEIIFEEDDFEIKIMEGRSSKKTDKIRMGKFSCFKCNHSFVIKDPIQPPRCIYIVKKKDKKKSFQPLKDSDQAALIKAEKKFLQKLSKLYEFDFKYQQPIHSSYKSFIKKGFKHWEDLFIFRQLLMLNVMQNSILNINLMDFSSDFEKNAITIYLSLAFSRFLEKNCIMTGEIHGTIRPAFSRRQPIFKYDFAEFHPSKSKILFEFERILKIVEKNITIFCDLPFNFVPKFHQENALNIQLEKDSVDIIILDPPYLDNINYQGNRDFYRVWMEKMNIRTNAFALELNNSFPTLDTFGYKSKVEAHKDYFQNMGKILSNIDICLKKNGIIVINFLNNSEIAFSEFIEMLIFGNYHITSIWPYELQRRKLTKLIITPRSKLIITCRIKQNKKSANVGEIRISVERVLQRNFFDLKRIFEKSSLKYILFGKGISIITQYQNSNEILKDFIRIREIYDIIEKLYEGDF